MEIIFKGANQGKTMEALELVAAFEGSSLFISNEETTKTLSQKLVTFPVVGEVVTGHAAEPEDVLEAIELFRANGLEFDCIALDVNFVTTHQKWFNLAMKLENEGFVVIGTQMLLKAGKSPDGKVQVVETDKPVGLHVPTKQYHPIGYPMIDAVNPINIDALLTESFAEVFIGLFETIEQNRKK